MQVWRICKQKHQATAFTGEGGLHVAGRWTPQGFRAVYTSESLALASLEVFVHIESNRIPLASIRAFLDGNPEIEEVEVAGLPPNWQAESAYPALQALGADWLRSQRTPILKVPSAIIPIEFNYILNPEHPQLQLSLNPPLTFQFDERMWKKP